MLDPGRLTRTLFLVKLHSVEKCDPQGKWVRLFCTRGGRCAREFPGSSSLWNTCGSAGTETGIIPTHPRFVLLRLQLRFKNVLGSGVEHTWVCVIAASWGIEMNFSHECDPFWTMLCDTRISMLHVCDVLRFS